MIFFPCQKVFNGKMNFKLNYRIPLLFFFFSEVNKFHVVDLIVVQIYTVYIPVQFNSYSQERVDHSGTGQNMIQHKTCKIGAEKICMNKISL